MKVDTALLTANHTLTEKLKEIDDFNTMLLRTANELFIENERLSGRNKELESRIDTLKIVNKRNRAELDSLRVENDDFRMKNEELTRRLEVCEKELDDRKETFMALINRYNEKIHSLTIDNRILRKKLEELEG